MVKVTTKNVFFTDFCCF